MGEPVKVMAVYAEPDSPVEHREVEAVETTVPGLVIHPPLRDEVPGWTLTHAPTGFAVGWFPESELEDVQGCAADLGPVTDWAAVEIDPGALRGRVLPILRRWGVQLYRSNVTYDEYRAGQR